MNQIDFHVRCGANYTLCANMGRHISLLSLPKPPISVILAHYSSKQTGNLFSFRLKQNYSDQHRKYWLYCCSVWTSAFHVADGADLCNYLVVVSRCFTNRNKLFSSWVLFFLKSMFSTQVFPILCSFPHVHFNSFNNLPSGICWHLWVFILSHLPYSFK